MTRAAPAANTGTMLPVASHLSHECMEATSPQTVLFSIDALP